GDYAYVADDRYGLVIVDISDPANPQQVGRLDTGGWAEDVVISGDYAYVANWGNGLVIVDISNPNMPQLVADMLWITIHGVSVAQ
ncbi:MAG: hypothetical protein H5T93_05375, partial [Pseudothermotoga sp.]|nr:hypothetical protein [Pseudothermotoga sp.]